MKEGSRECIHPYSMRERGGWGGGRKRGREGGERVRKKGRETDGHIDRI
jgi:hypothetical protein